MSAGGTRVRRRFCIRQIDYRSACDAAQDTVLCALVRLSHAVLSCSRRALHLVLTRRIRASTSVKTPRKHGKSLSALVRRADGRALIATANRLPAHGLLGNGTVVRDGRVWRPIRTQVRTDDDGASRPVRGILRRLLFRE